MSTDKLPGLSGLLRALGAVLGTGLLAILDALQVKRTAHDVVTHTGQVLHAAAAHQDHRVFLEVVAFTADVGDDFEAVGQADLGDLPQRGVRLLRRRGVHAGADAAALRAVLHRGRLGLGLFDLASMAHELIDGWHWKTSLNVQEKRQMHTRPKLRESLRVYPGGGKPSTGWARPRWGAASEP